ncbi:MAG: alpha-amylase, partial [Flavobacteriaceae bacterium]|nr:alpha-amylase [Flavobacteriaceae bacterium]
FELKLPESLIVSWKLKDGHYKLTDALYNEISSELVVENGLGSIKIKLGTLESFILKLENIAL